MDEEALGELEMNVSEAEELLRELASSVVVARVEVGTRDRPPHTSAYLKLTPLSGADDYAVVWTPGDRWFSLEVNGGYSLDVFGEDCEEPEVKEILERFLGIATAYIEGRWSRERSRFLHVVHVVVATDDGPVRLRR